MTQLKKWILVFFLLSLTLFICLIFTAFTLGRSYLVIEGNPKPSDVIIVLSGNSGRLEKGVTLYEEGLAEKIMLSNSEEPGTTVEEAVELGVPREDIIPEPKAVSTYTNATRTKDLMKELGFTSAIVVTSNYHTKRSKMTFEALYKGSGIDLSYASAPSDFTTEGEITPFESYTVFSEYIKLAGYWLRLQF